MAKWFNRIKERINSLKEDEGRGGLLPWLSVDVQKWALIGVACMGGIVIIVAAARGNALIGVLVGLAAGFLCYVGIRTRWLMNIDTVNSATRVGAGAIVVAGVLAGVVFLMIAIAAIVLWAIAMIILAVILFGLLGVDFIGGFLGDRSRGETRGDLGETISDTRTIRSNPFREGSGLSGGSGMKLAYIEKAWFTNEPIIRADDGTEIGSIRQDSLRQDLQEIFDTNFDKVGEIRTDLLTGRREVVDESGNHVGFIEKDWLGRTTINRD